MDFFVREMREKDIVKVRDIAVESWRATYAAIIPREIQDDFLRVAYSDEMLKKRLGTSHMWVAETAGEVAGFVDFSPADETGRVELRAIYFYPDEQRKGMGTALLKRGMDELVDSTEIIVEVEKENRIGLQFYEAKGFKVVKEFDEDFAGHLMKTVQMVLVI
ncbi:GNAT family N-acetyltransferase [Sporosarcina sp. P1]|uniref:GNAT family N-acetyltransferase n=1 Tax=Sporosarcina sp. P1 TaxID=2048257 RepID=UPI000C16F11C|nr:GNAT family N-acetyltransferase [Sporosarcina sp. P1]PIC83846.1 GNAT family N-acetyltransferase [Sporosarcina sp. P1]